MAAAYGNLTAVKILLRRGANALARNSDGQTPIEAMIDDDEELIDRDGNVVVGIVKQRLCKRWQQTRELLRQAMKTHATG